MSSSTSAALLAEDNVAAYVSKHASEIGVFPADAILTGKAIAGGNINFAFCVSEEATGKTVFVKQAPEYVAVFGPDGVPLTSARMHREYAIYMEWNRILGKELAQQFLPQIYFFDDKMMCFAMTFLDGYTLLDSDLVAKGMVPSSVATSLADFMSRTHAATHCTMIPKERADEFSQAYENRAMRDIQLAFVFTKCYKEASEEQLAGLVLDEAFLAEVESLKDAYQGKQADNLCLTHGDLHPGSVMVRGEDVKIIDPEFTIYGPPALDVGSLLSGFVLAAVHHAFAKNVSALKSLSSAAVDIWNAYKASMLKAGVSENVVKGIEVDTVGFTVAEVARTALGFAGGRLWLQFEDQTVKKAAQQAALKIVGQCMIARHNTGIATLFTSMDELVAQKS
eukprot:TRINITY_DN52160_c0_g1_i1.p1 TRINITY_DN52160_c0_g1~~TRINITY_DN52160_c0_g1_i1.p1  ORF type:complete len:394 (-),score=80.05 TRINITY_DN52160_c0_g1_i1:49-1230(-)